MDAIKEAVQKKYGEAAKRAQRDEGRLRLRHVGCCGVDPITSNLYDDDAGCGASRPKPCSRRSAAATRQRSRS